MSRADYPAAAIDGSPVQETGGLNLPSVRGRYSVGASLSQFTWFRVGGVADVIYKPADLDDLCFFLSQKPDTVSVTPLGVGSNVLVRDGGVSGVVLRLGRGFTNIAIHDGFVDVGAGVLDRTVARIAAEEGRSGLEFLCSIPGTIGGAIRMNAGCYGTEIRDVVECVFAVDGIGKYHTLTAADLGMTYRHCAIPDDWVFTGARFKTASASPSVIEETMNRMLNARAETQPIHTRTGGSTFANPPGAKAWELIDGAGCRGLSLGMAAVSTQHCNFLINLGGASAVELESLGMEVQRRVFATSGVSLNWEIKRIGIPKPAQSDDVAPLMFTKKTSEEKAA